MRKLILLYALLFLHLSHCIAAKDTPISHDATADEKLGTIKAGVAETKDGNQPHVETNYTHTTGNHSDGSHGNESHDTEGHGDGDGGHGGHDRIHLVTVDIEHVKNPLVFGIVVIIAGLSKIGFHHANFLSSKVPESCILILLGVVLGAIIHFSGIGENLSFFAPHEFFLYLLPPIILEAAFSLHDRTFSENIGSIIMFSVVGTIIACFTIGLTLVGLAQAGAMEDPGCSTVQMLVFSALIVAVDPVAVLAIFQEVGVNNMLYFLVFGESLLNDGVTVVLYNVMQTYNRMDTIEPDQVVLGILKFFVVVFGGLLIGVLSGFITSFLTKYTNSVKVVEPIIIFGFAYQSYILAEMFHFSGIISIIGCGLTQMQYAMNNITNKSKLAVKFCAKVMSNTCEIIIFLFLGLKVVIPNHVWNTGFILWTLVLCVVYRFIIVFVMAWLINRCDTYRVRKIKLDEMFMISYGGLRGAVCFSLVALLDEREFPMKDMFVTATLFVIFFTVFIQGGSIKWLVKKFRVSLQHTYEDMILYQELNQHVSDHVMAGIEEIVGQSGKYYLREKFDRMDDNFIRPVFLRDPKKGSLDDISQYYEKLMMKEHYKNLRLCGVKSLPHGASDLHAVDSSGCLKVMDDEFEQRALEKDEKLQDKRSRLISQRSMKSAETPEGTDLHKLFRSALVSSKNAHNFRHHDKNYTGDERRLLVGHLRKKYKQNARLSTIHPPVERALSWSENEGAECIRRKSDTKLNRLAGGRAHTVDLSNTAMSQPTSPVFALEDTVFEEDENNSGENENNPLLNNDSAVSSHKQVQFQISEGSNGSGHKRPSLGNSEGHAGGQLLRQDAVKDTDIPLQDLGPMKTEKAEKSVNVQFLPDSSQDSTISRQNSA